MFSLNINYLLLRLGLSGVSLRYFRVLLEIALEQEDIPFGVYRMAAHRTGASEKAIQKAVSRYGPDMWERGRKLNLWVEEGPFVSPRHLLTELLVLLSKQ